MYLLVSSNSSSLLPPCPGKWLRHRDSVNNVFLTQKLRIFQQELLIKFLYWCTHRAVHLEWTYSPRLVHTQHSTAIISCPEMPMVLRTQGSRIWPFRAISEVCISCRASSWSAFQLRALSCTDSSINLLEKYKAIKILPSSLSLLGLLNSAISERRGEKFNPACFSSHQLQTHIFNIHSAYKQV